MDFVRQIYSFYDLVDFSRRVGGIECGLGCGHKMDAIQTIKMKVFPQCKIQLGADFMEDLIPELPPEGMIDVIKAIQGEADNQEIGIGREQL